MNFSEIPTLSFAEGEGTLPPYCYFRQAWIREPVSS
jgi:hypothetical protein